MSTIEHVFVPGSQTPGYALARAWIEQVVLEVESGETGLTADEAEMVRMYYAHLLDPETRPFFVNHLGRRIGVVVDTLRSQMPRGRILDVACGIGTQALLFALLGYEVEAVDLFPREIAILEKRRRYYTERFQRPLAIRAQCANATRLDANDFPPVDAVHIFEALSHIHPMEEFLQRAARLVRAGGLLIVSDTNGLNPLLRYRLFRETGQWTYTVRRMTDSSSGQEIPYAYKRVLSAWSLSRHLLKAGFQVTAMAGSGFIPPGLWGHGGRARVVEALDGVLVHIPANYLFSLSHTVVATRLG